MNKPTLPFLSILLLFSQIGKTQLNLQLKRQLDSMYVLDQKFRELMSMDMSEKADSVARVFGVRKENLVAYLWGRQVQVDSTNLQLTEQIIKEYGYPGKRLVGTPSNEAAFYVIQHSTRIDQYLPLIKKAADKGDLPFRLYAMMLDRALMYHEKEQVYGTQGKGFQIADPVTGARGMKMIIWPISDPRTVNQRRKTAGFDLSVEDNAKRLGIEYTAYTLEDVYKMMGRSEGDFNLKLALLIDSLKAEDQSAQALKNPDSAGQVFRRITRTNFPLIESILQQNGFPGYKLVGKESSDNYWILVQHSDFNVPFQKRVLKLMKARVDKGDASGEKYAYLIDRININEHKKQVYGTQVNMGEKGTTIKPCIDMSSLDKRRKAVGLAPISEYLKKCDQIFYQLNKDRLDKSK